MSRGSGPKRSAIDQEVDCEVVKSKNVQDISGEPDKSERQLVFTRYWLMEVCWV